VREDARSGLAGKQGAVATSSVAVRDKALGPAGRRVNVARYHKAVSRIALVRLTAAPISPRSMAETMAPRLV